MKRSPFFLYPDLPRDPSTDRPPPYPLPWGERLDALYGPGVKEQIRRLGAAVGYRFNFAAPGSNTLDSHRLLLWAERQGRGPAFGKALAHAYFEEAQPLADHDVLTACAESAGLPAAEARAVLEDDTRERDAVDAALRFAAESGIRSIPVFLFNDSRAGPVHGSASVAQFEDALQALAEAP